MSEFKISRLRFSWVGNWQDQYVYNKDEIVQYEGKAYVCLIPHTSNAFYSDLGAVEPKWELMMTGQTWKGPWSQFQQYSLDNIVIFGGVVYKCNEQHLSGSIIDPDIDKWDTYAESKTWKSEWTSSTTYGPGDIVNYGGSSYECIVAHVSAETDLLGLEDDYTAVDDSTEKFWKIAQEGVQWRGDFATSTEDSSTLRYKLNDLVKYGPSIYKCNWGHAPTLLGELSDEFYYAGQIKDDGRHGEIFDRSVEVNGLKLVAATNIGGQIAVPDEWIRKTARTIQLLTDPNGIGINAEYQKNLIKTLRGDVGTPHAGIPAAQRIAYGSGDSYTPNWLQDENVSSYTGYQYFLDTHVVNDMVWYKNTSGPNPSVGDRDIEEIIEHLMHTIHLFGIPGAVPGADVAIAVQAQENPNFQTTELHVAMIEAMNAGVFNPSEYVTVIATEDPESLITTYTITDPEQAEIAYKEYLYLLNWSMWGMSEFWAGGSLAPEWTLIDQSGVQENNPLGYALFNTYIGPVLSKPNFVTLRNIFQNSDLGVSGYQPDVTDNLAGNEGTWVKSYWDLWLPGLDYENVWNSNSIYQPGDIVLYGGYLFQSIAINNIGSVPSTTYGEDSTDAWELVSKAFDVEGVWDNVTPYKIGSVVTYGGDLYVALVDSQGVNPGNSVITAPYEAEDSAGTRLQVNFGDSVSANSITVGMTVTGEGFGTGQTVEAVSVDNDSSNASQIATITLSHAPDGTITDEALITFSGAKAGYWEVMIPGFSWEGRWNTDTLYNIDDIAYYGNATYYCLREHTSSLVNRPDYDLQNTYWTIYLQHDQRNILSSPGEMIMRDSSENTTLAIGEQNSILKVINGLPTWSDLDFTPNVYYVATNGIDAIGRGTTPDTAWRTVNYACANVLEGTLQQNAKVLLEKNKEFIVQEAFNWFLYQQNEGADPFVSSYDFDNSKVIRDARQIVDAVTRDLIRGGNSNTVAAALSYFDLESTNRFTNDSVAEQRLFFQVFFVERFNLIELSLTNTPPAVNYQQLEADRIGINDLDPEDVAFATQWFNSSLTLESDTLTVVNALERIYLESFAAGSPDTIPPANESAYSTIFIRAGTYDEQIPILIPANTALNGDELRGTTIQPATPINTLCTRTQGDVNLFTVGSTLNMENNTPVQFVSLNPVDEISTILGGVTAGQTYYVIGSSITPTTFSVAETKDATQADSVELRTNIGNMYVYGGEALHDMFHVRNATGIRNMTVKGLRGTLTAENEFLTRRPTGGAYVALDPGEGPDDTRAWITYKSPYVQNVTTFGTGCTGMKIDSTLHNGGNRSMVSNDFTQILSDGIGIWCKGGDALTEAVSVFSYYGYAGYFAEDGAKMRATNGNSSYGTYGCVAEGFDISETPAVGTINNTSGEATAQAVSALGANAEILKIQYTHAGEQYYSKTTNYLKQSNNLISSEWENDSNITIIRAPTTPYVNEFAWKVTGNTSLSNSAYFWQDVVVSPQGRTYTNVAGINISGSGINATFNVTVNSGSYQVTVNNGGESYVVGNQITLSGKSFGGRSPENDIIVTVDELAITAVQQISFVGTVPEGSALGYNVSIHAKKGDSSYIDLGTEFTGNSLVETSVRFNFDTGTFTSLEGAGLVLASNLQADFLEDGWYRLSFKVVDTTALNTQLRMKVYPRGIDGISGNTNFYGAQITTSDTVQFFVETTDNTPTGYANIKVTGAGQGIKVQADELRTGSIFQARLLETADIRLGGLGYKIQTNNAQTGTTEYLTLAGSEVATAAEYEGTRLVVQSGKGAGQYGIIADYDPTSKQATIVKESFDPQEIVASTSTDNRLTISSDSANQFFNVYEGQKIQFTPTFYDIDINSISQSGISVVGTLGNLNNYMYVTATTRLRVGQKINFSGTPFGGVIVGFDYYIIDVIDDQAIQISTSQGGAVWPLTNVNIEDPDDSPITFTGEVPNFTLNYPDDTGYLKADTTANMVTTLPIQFTGTSLGGVILGSVYYIQDIINASQFTISESLVNVSVTETQASNNGLVVADTSSLTPLNPVIFKTGIIGGLGEKQTYFINSIISGTEFSLSSDTITRSATATEAVSNLITVDDTTGFIQNSPIVFNGVEFGNIDNDTVYYIQVVNDGTSFTVSEAPGGAALPLLTATGDLIVRTVTDTVVVTSEVGTMEGNTTGTKFAVEADRGTMEGSFFTEIFGGVTPGVTYFVKEKFNLSGSEITISETLGGAEFVPTNETGSMQFNEVGWDHINAGTPLTNTFDSTSIYIIEPRISFDRPPFTKVDLNPIAEGSEYSFIMGDGENFFAVPGESDTLRTTSDYLNLDLAYTLPISGTEVNPWVDGCHGNNTWFILSKNGQQSLYSVSNGLTWLSVNLPSLSSGEYTTVTYGNGVFVAAAVGNQTLAYSTDNCSTWTSVDISSATHDDYRAVAYGKEIFVAVDGSANAGIYSTDNGATWTETTIDPSGDSTVYNWRHVEFGNGRFVAVSEDNRPAAYSFDGINWYTSNVSVSATNFTYAQGVFVAVDNVTGYCYTSADGITWFEQTDLVGIDSNILGFGIDSTTRQGWFVTIDSAGTSAIKFSAGSRAIARASISSSSISGVSMLEPGSGYDDESPAPGVKITDPNNSEEALIQVRVGNGTLGAPTFTNFGAGYNTTSTAIAIRGDGFSDSFQTGLRFIAKEITRFPAPGDNLQFDGDPIVYRVAKAERLFGTQAPNLEAIITISPQLTQETAPANDTPFTIRSRFSQCRITNHDFLNIGYGNKIQSNYPNLPEDTGLEPQDEIVETNNGRVFYSSTDQDGNFRVGDLFAVEQATGIVTLSAQEFGLEGLTELTIGGVALGGSPTVVSEFSTDGTFVANSNNIVPTQKAIKTYLASRLSQGGSDTFTGLLQAGTVKVGGPDEITSSIPEGAEGFGVNMGVKVNVTGPYAGWSGDGLAMAYFMKTFVDPTRGSGN